MTEDTKGDAVYNNHNLPGLLFKLSPFVSFTPPQVTPKLLKTLSRNFMN